MLLLTTKNTDKLVTTVQRGKEIQKPKINVNFYKSKAYLDPLYQDKEFAHRLRKGWKRKILDPIC